MFKDVIKYKRSQIQEIVQLIIIFSSFDELNEARVSIQVLRIIYLR